MELFLKVIRILFYVFVAVALIGFAAQQWFGFPNDYWLYSGLFAIGCSLIRFFLRFV